MNSNTLQRPGPLFARIPEPLRAQAVKLGFTTPEKQEALAKTYLREKGESLDDNAPQATQTAGHATQRPTEATDGGVGLWAQLTTEQREFATKTLGITPEKRQAFAAEVLGGVQ